MSQIPSTLGSPSVKPFGENNTLNELNLDSFLKLMLTELQNQDPLNPLDNSQMLEQINQIREIGATDKLTGTLESVLLGQNITSSTNLIGQDINAISDDKQRVSGTVSRVSIENGAPKLHLDLTTQAEPSSDKGNVDKGKYSYRVVWQGANGMEGIELSGDKAVITTGDNGSIRFRNLPVTDGMKQIYRTNKTGTGDYQLVAVLTDGSQSTYLDTTGDGDRSETRQTGEFATDPSFGRRNFKVSLSNVADIFANGD